MLKNQMSKKKEILLRKCVATNVRYKKEELIRVVRRDQTVIIDPSGTCEGRGAYIVPDVDIIKKAKKKNAFSRAFRMKVDETLYDELAEMVGSK